MRGEGVFAWNTAENEPDEFVRRCKNSLRVGIVVGLEFIGAFLAGWIR